MPKKAVTLGALIRRINRKLAHEGEHLHRARTWTTDLGDYYVADYSNSNCGVIVAAHVNPEALGRELKVLHPHETIRDGGQA